MAQRTTVDKVRDVLVSGKDYDGSTDLQPFIDTAVVLADRVSSLDADSILDSTTLERIEAWLAAHLYCTPDRPRQSLSRGGANASYQGQTGMHLESTYYGQSAMDLDFTGTLRKINGGNVRAAASWLGRPPSSQTDYVDRD